MIASSNSRFDSQGRSDATGVQIACAGDGQSAVTVNDQGRINS